MKSHFANAFKALLAGYILTIAMLLVVSYLLYKFGLGEVVINILVVAIYVAACLLGGLLLAKLEKKKRLFWGMGYGIIYYVILFIVALVINRNLPDLFGSLRAMASCVLAGGVGGYISPN